MVLKTIENLISRLKIYLISIYCPVLPTKSDSDFMFCLQSHQGLRIDRSLVYMYYSYPQDRSNTQAIYRFALAQAECTSYINVLTTVIKT